jgi:hypothetical protein
MRRRALLATAALVVSGCLGRRPSSAVGDDHDFAVGTLTVRVLNRTDEPQRVVVTIRGGAETLEQSAADPIPPNVSRTTTHTVPVGEAYAVRVDGDGWGVGGPWKSTADCDVYEITAVVYERATEATVGGCHPGYDGGDAVATTESSEGTTVPDATIATSSGLRSSPRTTATRG